MSFGEEAEEEDQEAAAAAQQLKIRSAHDALEVQQGRVRGWVLGWGTGDAGGCAHVHRAVHPVHTGEWVGG